MADLNEIINLNPFFNPGFSYGRSVHRRTGLYFNVISNDDVSRLRNLLVALVVTFRKSKPVSSERHTILKDHPMSNPE